MMKNRSLPRLPKKKDFDPWGGNLDALWAWRNFGGLTLEEARTKFLENPFLYQEDFMWMGPRAFIFYLPIVIDYLKSTLATEETAATCEILGWGSALYFQLETALVPQTSAYFPDLLELVSLVRLRMPCFCYGDDPEAMAMIEDEWNDVEQLIHTHSQ